MVFCRTPSNRIGIYNSPAAVYLGYLDVSRPRLVPTDPPAVRFVLPNQAGCKRPWRHPNVKPNDLTNAYRAPFLSEREIDFLREEETVDDHKIECQSPVGKNSHSSTQQWKTNIVLNDSLAGTEKIDFKKKRKLGSVLEPESLIGGALDKERYFPHVVESPRRLHIESCLVQSIGPANIPEAAEEILKYQYYVEAGIDEYFIAPIRQTWMKSAVSLVGKHVMQGLSEEMVSQTLQHVSEEVHHEYIVSMRKAILDYILQC